MATRHRKRNGGDRYFVPFLRGSQFPLALEDQHRHFSLPGTLHWCLTLPCPTHHNLCLEVVPQPPRLVQPPTPAPPPLRILLLLGLLLRCKAVDMGPCRQPWSAPRHPQHGREDAASLGCGTRGSAGSLLAASRGRWFGIHGTPVPL